MNGIANTNIDDTTTKTEHETRENNKMLRTYDDTFSRNVTIDFFKKFMNINLIPHPGLVYKDTNILAKDGKYCIDLISDDYSVEVEVERNSANSPLFNKNLPYTDFSLIVSKFENYFRVGDTKTRFMVYVLDDGSQISIIHGDSIKKAYFSGVRCKWFESNNVFPKKLIHAYMMDMDISATFDTATGTPLYIGKNYIDVTKNIKNIMKQAEVKYTPNLFDSVEIKS